jgi:hypothetical protein
MASETDNGQYPPEWQSWPGAARPASWFLGPQAPQAPRDDAGARADDAETGAHEPAVGPTAPWGGGPGFAVPPGAIGGMPDERSDWQDSGISWERDPQLDEDAPQTDWIQPASYQTPPAFGAMLSTPTVADPPPRYASRPLPRPPQPDQSYNAWQPRQLPYPELPSKPIRRTRKTRRRVTPMTFVRLGVPAVVLAGVAVIAITMITGRTGQTLADRGDQPAPAVSQAGRPVSAAANVAPAFSQVNVSGDTVVAVGSQDSATPFFRVSSDGGLTWTTAVIRSQAGPVTGHQATIVAGGPGGWVGLGPNAIWTSANGLTWTLVSDRGLAAPGETITGLIKDSWGYLASGTSAGSATGLVWTSPNGLTWHEHTAAQFGLLDTQGERVFAMTDAATDWNVTLVAGSATLDGKTCAYVWRSLDLGASWRTVVVPQTHGASWSFAGLAGDASHFIAVRPGVTSGGVPEAVVYSSDDAINWHFATTITGLAGFTPEQVAGGSGRFVVTGHDGQGHEVAYTSTDNGTTWTPSDGFGVLPTA